MRTTKQYSSATEWAENLWNESWTHIKTVVNTVRDPFLVLDQKLCVLAANKAFYKLFQVEAKDTEGKRVYELGGGEWNIPALGSLLEGIMPRGTSFTGFEVSRKFPMIGRKVMLLNGRRIYKDGETSEMYPPIILLAMEDITQMADIAKELAEYSARIEGMMAGRTAKLETDVSELRKAVGRLKPEITKKLSRPVPKKKKK